MRKLIVVMLLAGTANATEFTPEQKQAITNIVGPKCEALGIAKESERWKGCIQGFVLAEALRQNNNLGALGNALRGAGSTLNPQVYQNTYGAPAPVITNCTTDFLGTHCTTGY